MTRERALFLGRDPPKFQKFKKHGVAFQRPLQTGIRYESAFLLEDACYVFAMSHLGIWASSILAPPTISLRGYSATLSPYLAMRPHLF